MTLAGHDETEDLKEFFEERAGILEYDAGLPRAQAELEAARITATLARNRGYLWASLRAALAEYPALLTVLPDRPGQVDALPPRRGQGGGAAWAARGAAGGVQRGGRGEAMTADTPDPEPRYERFRLTYPSGTVIESASPLTLADIAGVLGLARDDQPELARVLHRLKTDGAVTGGPTGGKNGGYCHARDR